MRLSVRHQITYGFETPATSVVQTLRLTPRNYEGQHVVRWRLDVDRNCRLRSSEDAFGNLTHVFAAEGPIDTLTVLVEGEVETTDNAGVVRSTLERFPPALYLRSTDLTAPDLDISVYAEQVVGDVPGDVLAQLHTLLAALHEDMAFERGPRDSMTTAAEAFRLKRGASHDLAHVFLVAARRLGIPARYVSGYYRRDDDVEPASDGGHAWVEAHVPGLGWVGFDPSTGLSTTERHVRLASGLDYLGAAPVRGTHYGGGGETLQISAVVKDCLATRNYRRSAREEFDPSPSPGGQSQSQR